MLAYLFWHTKAPATDGAEYERQLVNFHSALQVADIGGFVKSQSFRVRELPWVPQSPTYEDWYLLEDSAALDRLNQAAVRDAAQTPHDRLAAGSNWGAGGLYGYRSGLVNLSAQHAFWFGKPESLSYAQLYQILEQALPGTASLWQRRMVLGPGSEFCALCDEQLPLALPLTALHIARSSVD